MDGVEAAVEEVIYEETFWKERVEQIRSGNTDKINEIASLRDVWRSQAMQFMAQVLEFSENYGLASNNRQKRMENARLSVTKVTAEVEDLQQEIEEQNTRLAEIKDLITTRESLGTALETMSAVENEIQLKIREEDSTIRLLQKENQMLKIAPESGVDFVQVNEDLSRYRTDPLETRAEDLHAQLSDVTEELRRQEGQTLRLQFRKWQRLRQHQQGPGHLDLDSQQQQQQEQNAEPADDSSEDYPHQMTFQAHPEKSLIEVIVPDCKKTITMDSTDRPGFGMSAQREVLFQQSTPTDGLLTVAPSCLTLRNNSTAETVDRQELQREPRHINTTEQNNARPVNHEPIVTSDAVLVTFASDQTPGDEDEKLAADVPNSEMATSQGRAENPEPPELKLIYSQDDILCPSASTVSEAAAHSNKELIDGTSQNTIFISSPS